MNDSSPEKSPPPPKVAPPMTLDYAPPPPPRSGSARRMDRAQRLICVAAIGWQIASTFAGIGSDRISIHPFKKWVITVAAISIGLAFLLALRRANPPALFMAILALFFLCTPCGTFVMWFHN